MSRPANASEPAAPSEGRPGREFRNGKWWQTVKIRSWYCVKTWAKGDMLVAPYTHEGKLLEMARRDHLDQDGLCSPANVRLVTSKRRDRLKAAKEH